MLIVQNFRRLEKLLSRRNMDPAIIRWQTSCHTNRMTTRYITHCYWHDAVRDNNMFLIEIMSVFKTIISHLKHITLMVISYEMYETR